jgi:hypothetical protein
MEDEEGCAICLEAGGDAPAPCGFVGARFHRRCLARWRACGAVRCPHCNRSRWGVREALSRLLVGGGCWTRGCMASAAPPSSSWAEADAPMRASMREAAEALREAFAPNRMRLRMRRVDAATVRVVGECPARRRAIEVALQRAARVGAHGRVLWHGFELFAVRRRVGERARRAGGRGPYI